MGQMLQEISLGQLGGAGGPAAGYDRPQQGHPGLEVGFEPGGQAQVHHGVIGQGQAGRDLIGPLTRQAQFLKHLAGLTRHRRGLRHLATFREGTRFPGEGQPAVKLGLRGYQLRWQAVIVSHGLVGQFAHDLHAAGGLQFLVEILEQKPDQLLGLAPGSLGQLARMAGRGLGGPRPAQVDPAEHRTAGGEQHQHNGHGGHHAGAQQRAVRRQLPFLLQGDLAPGLLELLALAPDATAGPDDTAQHVVGDFHPAHVEAVLDAQQPAVDQQGERLGRRPGGDKALAHAFLGHALAEAGIGQQHVLDESAHAGRLVHQGPGVEFREDRVARAGQQVGGDLRLTGGQPGVVQLPADEAEQRRLDLGPGEIGAAGNKTHHGLGHGFADEVWRGSAHCGHGLRPGHAGQPHAVLRDGRHLALEPLEMRQVILAQQDQNPIVRAREVKFGGVGLVAVDPGLERPRRTIFHQVREIGEEFLGPLPSGIIGLGQSEDFLELVEDQNGNERAAIGVLEHVVAMMQELPQGLTGDGGAALGPGAGRLGGAEDGPLDLVGGRRGMRVVVEPHIDRAKALGTETRHETSLQDGGLAEAGLAEEHGQQLALHPAAELGGLLLAAMEIATRLLGEGNESKPGMLGVDRCDGDRRRNGTLNA